MIYLKSIAVKDMSEDVRDKFPFCLPVISSLDELKFETEVTILVGENGSGKSTLLESLAAGCELPMVGSSQIDKDESMKNAVLFSRHLVFRWGVKNHRGFFLRAEDFFGFAKNMKNLQTELESERDRFDKELPEGYGKRLAMGAIGGQIDNLTRNYGEDLNYMSHGESFLQLFKSRIVPGGLYLLDEPEAPLSVVRQLGLMSLINKSVGQKSQFIIATHSPIIMSYPGATIYDLSSGKIEKKKFSELEQVKMMGDFLQNSEVYLRKLDIIR